MNKTRTNITVDPIILKEAKAILSETGVPLSSFIEIVLKGLINSKSKTMDQMMGEMVEGLIEGSEMIKKNGSPLPPNKGGRRKVKG